MVIGSGIAGLSVAIQYAREHPNASVTLLAKKELPQTNTELAQGGIAAAVDLKDAWEQHANDTLKVGGRRSNASIVRMVVRKASSRIAELMKEGVAFDRNPDGSLATAREGGHTRERILHVGDQTGSEIQNELLQKAAEIPRLRYLPFHHTIELIVENERCQGAFILNEESNEINAFLASNTVLAMDGLGRIYERTSNAPIATGDGYAMGRKAGLEHRNMGAVQFHPTAFYGGKENHVFLISEAARGEGARLLNSNGEVFAGHYDRRGELAPRKILSQAIAREMERTRSDHVLLDTSILSEEAFAERFPKIHSFCQDQGIRPGKDPIPVAPAAHYCCGGVPVGADGRTELNGLLACGEVSCTGLLGSDRLPSNSLLEGLVFAEQTAQALKMEDNTAPSYPSKDPPFRFQRPDWERTATLERIQNELRVLMTQKASVLRDEKGSKELLRELDRMQDELERCFPSEMVHPLSLEVRNLLETARAVVGGRGYG